MSNKKVSGLYLLTLALFPFAVWYILVTVANPQNVTWQDNLNQLLLGEDDLSHWFYTSIVSSIVSLLCSITYFSRVSNSKQVLLLLLIICTFQAVVAAYFFAWDLKVIYSVPVLLAFLTYKETSKKRTLPL